MTPKERTLALAILAVNLAVGVALTRRADLRELLTPAGPGLVESGGTPESQGDALASARP